MKKLELASGGVTAAEVASGSTDGQFLGYPVTISQVMPATEANSQVCALFGNFSLAGSFGDRTGIGVDFSEHATIGGENVFERNQIAVRGIERFDINVHDVGTATDAGPVVGLITAAS
jgi:HK97 family phage major capsid protein